MSRRCLIHRGTVVVDTTPDAFTFTDVTNVALSTTETSNTITVAGLSIGASAAVTVSGGTFQKNGGSFGSSASTAVNGDTFAVRHTSSSSNSTAVNTTLTIGGVSDTYTSTTLASASVTYDTSVGNGVDVNGFTSLPLHAGAKRIYVKNGGSDAANGLTHATAVATIAHGQTLLTSGVGDHLLIAQGSTFAEGLPNMYGFPGFSAVYPTAIQSYDPADPTNAAKMGVATGANRPIINTGSTAVQTIASHTGTGGASSPAYIAIRGLDFTPSNSPDLSIGFFAEPVIGSCYVLIENNIFRYTTLGVDLHQGAARGTNWVIRNNSFIGQWSNDDPTQGQAIYLAFINGATVEDNVFYHVGWKVGASRLDDMSIGGLTVYRHPIYFQDDAINCISRRNGFLDGYDGGSLRGDGITHQQNFSIKNCIGFALGRGDHYTTNVPNGAVQDASYSIVMGGGLVTGGVSDLGAWMYNGKSGQSAVHHNVFARSLGKAGWTLAPDTSGDPAHPTYCDFHDNVCWNYANSGSSTDGEPYGPTVFATYENNIWDDPVSGSNTNISTHTLPNTYDEAGLMTALGYADYAAFIADATNNPEKHVQRHAVNLMLAGYGVDTSSMPYLPNS